jgi:hypothetical protein
MHHPKSRSERRFNGEVWRDRQRFIMKNCWWSSRNDNSWFLTNVMWWARKQCSAHGNRCACHIEKITEKRSRRRALDQAVIDNLLSWEEE